MEPMNCVIQRTADGLEVWNGEQFQTVDQGAGGHVRPAAGEGEHPHALRRRQLRPACQHPSDYIREAASIVKASGTRAPVKLVWMREDDMKGGLLPAHVPSRLEATLDADGSIRAWRHRLVGQSIAKGSPFEPS
jgi:isoquinoline 1-oxidoreductase beta subunit